jgi:hypothetical protein
VLLIGSVGVLALAANHFFVNWLLYTDALMRWFQY